MVQCRFRTIRICIGNITQPYTEFMSKCGTSPKQQFFYFSEVIEVLTFSFI